MKYIANVQHDPRVVAFLFDMTLRHFPMEIGYTGSSTNEA